MKYLLITFLLFNFFSCKDHTSTAFCDKKSAVDLDLQESQFRLLTREFERDFLIKKSSDKTSSYEAYDGKDYFGVEFCRVGFKIFAEIEIKKYQKFFLTKVTEHILKGPYELRLLEFDENLLISKKVNYEKHKIFRYIEVDNSNLSQSEQLSLMKESQITAYIY